MAVMKKVRRMVNISARQGPGTAPGTRAHPECVVLGVRDGVAPSPKPPVRIFLGTEPAQYRAERVFFWSIEQVRDPGRIYEISVMKDLVGFDRREWLTGFTNYRFAIPYFASGSGRAIYNDVDQVYLTDPGELFDIDLGGHGFLSISDRDTSVMLLDCARMAFVWTLETAQHEWRKPLEAKARALWGPLDPAWNARDEEYAFGRSKLLHYTRIHAQPWQPFPQRYAYQRNPVGHIWLDLERAANAAEYQVFAAARPSAQYTALLTRLHMAWGGGDQPQARLETVSPFASRRAAWSGRGAAALDLKNLAAQFGVCTILDYRFAQDHNEQGEREELSAGGAKPVIMCYTLPFPPSAEHPAEQFDGVVCADLLDYLPDEDMPWILDELFRRARRFVYVTVHTDSRTKIRSDGTLLQSRPRDDAWWHASFAAAGARHPDTYWRLILQTRTRMGNQASSVYEGGPRPGGSPSVWVLADDRPGNTTQSVGLARALGWPYEVKELHFTDWVHVLQYLFGARIATKIGLDSSHSAALTPPWPDLVVATGWRSAPVARWISRQSQGRTRLVQLGRKGGSVAELFDVVVSCPYFRLPPHPRRIEIAAPLTQVTPERLAEEAERWQHLFDNAPHPRIALLVGGPTARYRLDAEIAQRLGERIRAFAHERGGSVFATASRRTGPEATESLQTGLGGTSYLHRWQLGQQDNPYLAYLALADVLVVTGESESMLAEAAATGKPVYIYALPERPLGLKARLREWVVVRAQAESASKRGTARPQQGLAYVCAWLIKCGIVRPRRDLNILHQTLVQRGIARFFGEPLEEPPGKPLDMRSSPVLREIDAVARQVRILLGRIDDDVPQL